MKVVKAGMKSSNQIDPNIGIHNVEVKRHGLTSHKIADAKIRNDRSYSKACKRAILDTSSQSCFFHCDLVDMFIFLEIASEYIDRSDCDCC